MNQGVQTIVCPVSDLGRAKMLYATLLGVEPYTDEPYYVGFRVGEQELGLDPNGHKHGMTPYWQVDDIRERLLSLLDAGAQITQDVKEVGGGRLVASVKDADGNVIGLLQQS